MRDLIASRPGEKLTLRVERDDQERLLTLKTLAQETDDGVAYGLIGIEPEVDYERRKTPLGQSIRDGVRLTRGMIGDVYGGFWMLVSKPGSFKDNVAGPLTIAQLAGSSRRPSQMLYVLAFISMALMALNLLPIPILDGGHAMFCLIEGVRGKKLSDRSQLALQKVGLVLIGSLVVMALFNDVKRFWERNQAVHRIERQETGESP